MDAIDKESLLRRARPVRVHCPALQCDLWIRPLRAGEFLDLPDQAKSDAQMVHLCLCRSGEDLSPLLSLDEVLALDAAAYLALHRLVMTANGLAGPELEKKTSDGK